MAQTIALAAEPKEIEGVDLTQSHYVFLKATLPERAQVYVYLGDENVGDLKPPDLKDFQPNFFLFHNWKVSGPEGKRNWLFLLRHDLPGCIVPGTQQSDDRRLYTWADRIGNVKLNEINQGFTMEPTMIPYRREEHVDLANRQLRIEMSLQSMDQRLPRYGR